MAEIKDGGPAFPRSVEAVASVNRFGREDYRIESVGGMSLRDYFAAAAMRGLVSSVADVDVPWAAGKAYELADAMLQARAVSQ
jgi:hypothetical protein